MFTITRHQLVQAKQIPSPNYNERPVNNAPELVVIHCISLPPGEYGGPYIEQLFTNDLDPHEHPYFEEIYQLRVSSHLLITRKGEVVQFVPFNKRAWHAGQSSYQGRENCNDYSIGIELEGTDSDIYEPQQYELLAQVLKALYQYYPTLNPQKITGHQDIAPERKTDPGPGFDWQRLYALIRQND